MDFALVTDSSCSLPEDFIHQNDITVLPLSFMVGTEQYQCFKNGHYFDAATFYHMLEGDAPITTSLPNLAHSEAALRALLHEGKDILYVGFSSALSGTFESTALLMKALQVEYPQRTMLAVDTLGASLGEGLLIYYAVRLGRQGKSIHEVYSWLQNNRLHLAHWFTVDDLMFLHRGGRVSKTSAAAGTLLRIKPILHVNDEGELVVVEMSRGRKKALAALLNRMRETMTEPINRQMVFIVHANCLDDAQAFAQTIENEFDVKGVIIGDLDPVIAAHCGPGTIGLFFLAANR